MSLELLLVLSIVFVAVGVVAAVRRRTVPAALALTVGLLGVLVWVLEKSGTINL